MIRPTCDRCGHELDQLGGLAFSPPEGDIVHKFHICTDCWPRFTGWLSMAAYQSRADIAESKLDRFYKFFQDVGYTGLCSRHQVPDASCEICLSTYPDPEPQPTDGPEYHADHAAWEWRQ